jgi:hypothetical protein
MSNLNTFIIRANVKNKIFIFPLFNTCYPQNLARNLASF